ncbi:hypothetical protein O6H91_09G064400 [Diphasiastrum complanatum]|uniref:Uncharacterized protein n=6 Tax=Diphasiastrum complanatum TaxID=34168 RepID=A0ACC2CQF4_DIPCM|nr:hypothetical protein O6H91_09G064400 [Diphasiastrum complanatum]KAJ7544088.1 hypothetical protein O6H91_09G064400 [Diphasiastrum complanatum]KAJ7544089.1 hypothetical protein O6H91_09G064400 [Diphasiastrum complanatum]KAJ7544090.1 hypothetical protein O6H91_09G064400 [Diphasiastrum complanatum]KAJ7544091.1 hypothetical protein O6H91_09G064400 [Diphasiastrum complanatum]
MALYRQGGGNALPMNGNHKTGPAHRLLVDHVSVDHHEEGGSSSQNGWLQGESSNVFGRSTVKWGRGKRFGRAVKNRKYSVWFLVAVLLFGVLATLFAADYWFAVGRAFTGERDSSTSNDFFDHQAHSRVIDHHSQTESQQEIVKHDITSGMNVVKDLNSKDSLKLDMGFHDVKHSSKEDTRSKVHFGLPVDGKVGHRDSRDWDSDDRKREPAGISLKQGAIHSENGEGNLSLLRWMVQPQDIEKKGLHNSQDMTRSGNVGRKGQLHNDSSSVLRKVEHVEGKTGGSRVEDLTNENLGLYNERGRKELRRYEEQFEADLKRDEESYSYEDKNNNKNLSKDTFQGEDVNEEALDDEEDDSDLKYRSLKGGYYMLPERQSMGRLRNQKENLQESGNGGTDSLSRHSTDQTSEVYKSRQMRSLFDETSSLGGNSIGGEANLQVQQLHLASKVDMSTFLEENKGITSQAKKSTHNWRIWDTRAFQGYGGKKRSGAPCEVNLLETTKGLKIPDYTPNFHNFSLNYVQSEEMPQGESDWHPRFAGHQTFRERENSFYARTQTIHCGFVQGPKGAPSTGFDLNDNDANYLRTCTIAVSSCVFGDRNFVRSPSHNKVSSFSKQGVCFVMFVDQKSLDVMIAEGRAPNADGRIGLWRVVLVENLPYNDSRFAGKVPKFLAHQLFPSARYSIWVDGKLRLQRDPILILEHLLWREHKEYAISNHYDRHCVSEEVQQNKQLSKFKLTAMDQQYAFYQKDGLPLFNHSDPNQLLTSYVPVGSFIVRAHTPMSNLFSCLWFNEVDRFTSWDQLSFAYTYLKLLRMNAGKHFHFLMFKDCERKALARLFGHKDRTDMMQ